MNTRSRDVSCRENNIAASRAASAALGSTACGWCHKWSPPAVGVKASVFWTLRALLGLMIILRLGQDSFLVGTRAERVSSDRKEKLTRGR